MPADHVQTEGGMETVARGFNPALWEQSLLAIQTPRFRAVFIAGKP